MGKSVTLPTFFRRSIGDPVQLSPTPIGDPVQLFRDPAQLHPASRADCQRYQDDLSNDALIAIVVLFPMWV